MEQYLASQPKVFFFVLVFVWYELIQSFLVRTTSISRKEVGQIMNETQTKTKSKQQWKTQNFFYFFYELFRRCSSIVWISIRFRLSAKCCCRWRRCRCCCSTIQFASITKADIRSYFSQTYLIIIVNEIFFNWESRVIVTRIACCMFDQRLSQQFRFRLFVDIFLFDIKRVRDKHWCYIYFQRFSEFFVCWNQTFI